MEPPSVDALTELREEERALDQKKLGVKRKREQLEAEQKALQEEEAQIQRMEHNRRLKKKALQSRVFHDLVEFSPCYVGPVLERLVGVGFNSTLGYEHYPGMVVNLLEYRHQRYTSPIPLVYVALPPDDPQDPADCFVLCIEHAGTLETVNPRKALDFHQRWLAGVSRVGGQPSQDAVCSFKLETYSQNSSILLSLHAPT